MARVVVLGVKTGVCFVQQDVTEEMPSGPFDVILSRYAVCLYLQTTQLSEVLPEMLNRLRPGGFLVIGAKDHLPNGIEQRYGLVALDYKQGDARCIFQKQPTSLPTPRMRGWMFKMIYLSSIVYYDIIYDIMIINYCHMSHIGQLFLMKELDGLDSSVEIFCRRCETRGSMRNSCSAWVASPTGWRSRNSWSGSAAPCGCAVAFRMIFKAKWPKIACRGTKRAEI